MGGVSAADGVTGDAAALGPVGAGSAAGASADTPCGALVWPCCCTAAGDAATRMLFRAGDALTECRLAGWFWVCIGGVAFGLHQKAIKNAHLRYSEAATQPAGPLMHNASPTPVLYREAFSSLLSNLQQTKGTTAVGEVAARVIYRAWVLGRREQQHQIGSERTTRLLATTPARTADKSVARKFLFAGCNSAPDWTVVTSVSKGDHGSLEKCSALLNVD